ncbi:DUF4956 domain-containing protein [bacterium]|nr:DUF4956 domain-containing protein [bacterium]
MKNIFLKIGRKSQIFFILSGLILILVLIPDAGHFLNSATAFAQSGSIEFLEENSDSPIEGPPDKGGAPRKTLWDTDWSEALNILATLFLASVLSGLVSYRRRGGSAQMDFTEAHIVLSAASALMMMIIGSQIARAFGLMGAASIVRYRYSLKSPKEASSLVIALGIGMACGVGLYPLAIIASLYIVVVINLIEHIPSGMKKALFPTNWTWNLRVRTMEPDETLTLIKEFLFKEDVGYKIKRVVADKGPESDQTEIEVEIFGNIDRNFLAEKLASDDVIRVQWKQDKSSTFDDFEIK